MVIANSVDGSEKEVFGFLIRGGFYSPTSPENLGSDFHDAKQPSRANNICALALRLACSSRDWRSHLRADQ